MGERCYFAHMEIVRTFSRSWGVLFAFGLGAGAAWGQTIGNIPAQNHTAGQNIPTIHLSLSGFEDSRVLRMMAANTTSGNAQSYEEPGKRIFQGLKPDIVMIQEFQVANNTSTSVLRSWVDETFGAHYNFFCENYSGIPNGVISRWPILQSGSWDDTTIGDRGFAWAQIDIPGEKNLWVISVHLKASSDSASQRQSQAQQLVAYIQANVPANDYLMVGGDCNTYSYSEACLATLGSVVDVSAPRPVDERGDPDTNAGRSSPYDWVMAEPELDALEVPVTIGTLSFPTGLVFDSRVFSNLSLVSPVRSGDSGVSGMQHMAVVRSFRVSAPEVITVQAQSSNATLLPAGNIQILGSGLSRSLQITPAIGQTGSSTVTVTVSDGVVTDTETFLVTVASAETPYQSWAVGYELSGANAGAEADPDKDGWSNAQEFAFGLVPNVAGGQLVQVPAGELKMTYRQRGGVTYVVRSATSLETGFDGTVTPTRSSSQPSELPSGYEQWEAIMPSGGRGFLKVEATVE
jgi:endonuclease/exonuclease/phosphatase (EEP) superfamily protein YafD